MTPGISNVEIGTIRVRRGTRRSRSSLAETGETGETAGMVALVRSATDPIAGSDTAAGVDVAGEVVSSA
jgi:hypothetical protein